MINSKHYTKTTIGSTSTKTRSKSIYRGDYSHTVSMHLKLDPDLSPETKRQSKDANKTYKQLFKDNQAHKYRDSLKIVEVTHSGKKSQR